MKKKKKKLEYGISFTFSIKDTTIFAKQGNVGTKGLKVIRGAANICKSTNWEESKRIPRRNTSILKEVGTKKTLNI